MPFILKSRVRETSSTTGTGSFTLSGAVQGHVTFTSVMATNDTTWYAIINPVAGEWEVGVGTLTGANTLARTSIQESSNAGAAVNFSAGTKDVFMDLLPSFTKALNSAEATITANTVSTIDLGAPGANRVALTLINSTITSFTTGAANANLFRLVRITSNTNSSFTHNAASLILPAAQNVTPAAGDFFIAVSDSSGNWRVINYQQSSTFAGHIYRTNGAATSTTLTTTDIAGATSQITLNMTGTLGAGANATLPTVASLVTALQGQNQGLTATGNQTYVLYILNTSAANFAWTVVTNTGWVLQGTMTIAQNTYRKFYVTIASGSATATLQSLGQYAINAGI